MSQNDENLSDEDDRECEPANTRSKSKNHVTQPKWICKKEPAWRKYIKKYANDARKRANAEREKYGEFYHMKQKEKDLSLIPKEEVSVVPRCQILSIFNQSGRRCIDGERPRTKIWDDIHHDSRKYDRVTTHQSFEWPNHSPCLEYDVVKEQKVLARKLKMKKLGATPCDIEEIHSPESSDDEKLEELASKKELIHARIPITSVTKNPPVMMDRACGERIGLVDGDCIVYEICYGEECRTYANLCLRGLEGMHLEELQRIREKTWKFCLFQNIVALLVKTQLRYKYAWSANIDYIYEQAWTIFLHTGYLNIKPNQRFDDILVYNYMYSVEIQLVHEIKDIPIIRDTTFEYFEESLVKQELIQRNKVTLMKCEFGVDKCKDNLKIPVHKRTRMLEKWFDNLKDNYTNCILRTTRFSLAFWQDGLFWYLYNPYRCDKYGLWDDEGFASITKFCTKDSLKRHIMILLVRAYAYKLDELDMCEREYNYFTIQIYQMIYHSCKIHNVKLYLRDRKKSKTQLVEKTKSDPCMFDPYEQLSTTPCKNLLKSSNDEIVQELNDKIEKLCWLQDLKITWSKTLTEKNECKKQKWHEFEVLVPRRLYVLWSDIHITDRIFAEKNRYKQARACYVVGAGMCLINAPEYWCADVLKAIVVCGDEFFSKRQQVIMERSKSENPRKIPADDDEEWQDYPSDQFKIGDILFDVNVLSAVRGRLYMRTDQCLWRSLELFFHRYHFGIFSCESVRLGIFKRYGVYYMLDVYSIGPPIFKSGDGKAYLLRASCMRELVTSLILVVGSVECSPFTIRPVEIRRILDMSSLKDCSRKPSREDMDCSYGAIRPKPACPGQRQKKDSKRGSKIPSYDDAKNKQKIICIKEREN